MTDSNAAMIGGQRVAPRKGMAALPGKSRRTRRLIRLLRLALAIMRRPVGGKFQAEKAEAGFDEHEARVWLGRQHHITLALLVGTFLSLRLTGGRKRPQVAARKTRARQQLLSQRAWTPDRLLHRLTDVQSHNDQAKPAHAARRRLRRIHPSL